MKALPGITAALTALSLLSCGNPDRGGAAGLPRLLDLGSKTCIPCKLMTPILDNLRKEFDGTLAVDFVEVGMGGDQHLAFAEWKIHLPDHLDDLLDRLLQPDVDEQPLIAVED